MSRYLLDVIAAVLLGLATERRRAVALTRVAAAPASALPLNDDPDVPGWG